MLDGSTFTRALIKRSPWQNSGGCLAEHRGIDGVSRVIGSETEALSVQQANLQPHRRASVYQTIERIDYSWNLFNAAFDLRRPFLEEVNIRRIQMNFDRAGRPHQIAKEIPQNHREFPMNTRKSGIQKLITITAVLARLIPILWETGIGSDVMKPIAAPIIGGMITSTIRVLILVPVFFALMNAH
jgi:hypothetical protein